MHTLRIRIAAAAALALSLTRCAPGAGPGAPPLAAPAAAPVVLDGDLAEWEGTAPAVQDPADAPAPYPDVREVRVRHDAAGMYLCIGFEREVSLQGLPGTLVLMLDWTGAADGWQAYGMPGVDATLEFSPAFGAGGSLGGIGVRVADPAGGAGGVATANVAGVIAAPTHSARRFEVRVGRDGPIPTGRPMTARLVALDRGGAVVEQTGAFAIRPGAPAPRPTPPGAGAADPLARARGTELRMVSWNVGREDLFEQADAFGEIVRALDPDLVVMDEVAGGHSVDEVEALLNRGAPGARPWRAVYSVSGGSQRGVIATRGAVPRVVAPFGGIVPYPDSLLALALSSPAPNARQAAEQRMADGVPTVGALVQVGGRTLLVVTMDLESGGGPGGTADRLRRMEAWAVRGATERALQSVGALDGWVMAGDVNLVGTREPLEILSRTAAAEHGLGVAQPLQLDGASPATWEDPADRFTPGRLDYVFYPRSLLTVAGGFVFASGDLSPRWRARHRLRADVSRATDHLPVVTDLRWVERGE